MSSNHPLQSPGNSVEGPPVEAKCPALGDSGSGANPDWDVIVIGGSLAGSATASLLLRRDPALRILILERSTSFSRRVGESTVEISAFFLGRVLGLTGHLLESHVPKQGMRFWFSNERVRTIDQCSETGPRYNVRLPGYQVDRSVLDQHLLEKVRAEGAVVIRSVRVRRVQLVDGGKQVVTWEGADAIQQVSRAKWVVDASGSAALLARQEGWLVQNRAHPTAACWSRWSGVKSLDGPELGARYPAWMSKVKGLRSTATNHLTGYGWWAWFIPLKGGDVSVGVVYDQRITELPPGPSLGLRLKAMLDQHPAGREMLAEAQWREGDVHFRRNLAYSSSTFATDGAVLVGDAAGFMDPFYSPGMDFVAYSATAAASLIRDSLRGRPVPPRVSRHNAEFALSYQRWFDAVYRDKYFYMGDQELMTLAFRLDLGLYYIGMVASAFLRGAQSLEHPPFTHPRSAWAFRLMACYNRRFAAIAESRRRRGVWGKLNDRVFFGFTSYEFNLRLPFRVAGLLGSWLGLELREGWRSWFSAAKDARASTLPLTLSAESS